MPAAADAPLPVIIDRIAAFIERYVFLPHKSMYRLLALWVVATYLHQSFDYMGYIFAHSATPESGKSRLLEVLDLIVSQPSGVIVSPTEAILFRTASEHTQLIDEADSCQQLDALRSVLNAGFHKGGTVKRMEKDETGSYKPVEFPVYAPRALAGIGQHILNQTTRDRTFMIQMLRQKRGERRERFRVRKVGPEARVLRKAIEQWVTANADKVAAQYDSASFVYLDAFRDRTIDITEPLAAIVEVAYSDAGTETLKRARLDLLDAAALTRKEQESPALDSRLIGELAKLARDENPLVGSASELVQKLGASVENVDELKVGEVLRRHGFEAKSTRKGGGEPRYRYSLSYESLADLAERYLGAGGVADGGSRREAATGPTTAQTIESQPELVGVVSVVGNGSNTVRSAKRVCGPRPSTGPQPTTATTLRFCPAGRNRTDR